MTKIRFILMVVVVGLFAVGCESQEYRDQQTIQYEQRLDDIAKNYIRELKLEDGTRCVVNVRVGGISCNWKGN